ncbi:MAG: hypothetical protein A2882_13695 [Phenylobacterium sp. RIFCSPHIGHO2_01_FULL_70_10]|nr:MAG: hypothetical protein A2882_13695 [Phenylobacterium sp. RIFCSPHIGHO2_01_FULL_70_10]
MSVVVVALSASAVLSIYERRAALREVARADCRQSRECSPEIYKPDVRAAIAAEDVVDLGVIQIVLGAVGLIFIGLTLAATRDAVREANEATEAAREAMRITEEHGRRQLRAYVSVKISVKDFTVGKKPVFVCHITNTGQTPARALEVFTAIRATADPQQHPVHIIDRNGGSRVSLGANAEPVAVNAPAGSEITSAMLEDCKAGRMTWLFAGYLRYYDVFGRRHFTLFRSYLKVRNGSVSMTMCRKHNTAN